MQELHSFLTGPLWLKLKADLGDLRLFGSADLFAATYFHVRRLLLVRPGWTCHSRPGPRGHNVDLVLELRGKFQALLHCEFMVKPGTPDWFPSQTLDERMELLRGTIRTIEDHGSLGRGYFFGVFDSGRPWLYPNETMWEKQSCFWVPTNCRELPKYADWRARWDKLAGRLGQ